jgi:EmrB/QacA subfamily drug resistance transporter
VLAFCQLVIAVDFNIVYVALPDIGASLGFADHELQWVISAYAIGFGGFLLLGGRVADRFGARRVLLIGLAVFAAACALGAVAQDPGTLVAARAVQGLGAALVTPAMLSLIFGVFPDDVGRQRALAAWGAAGAGGLALGALLGGVLTQADWRWTLAVLVPMAVVGLLWARAALPADQPVGGAGRFDLLGAALGTASAALLVTGLVEGPEVGWLDWRGGGAFAAALVVGCAFVIAERHHPTPLVDLSLFARAGFSASLLVILAFQSALLGGYFVFTTYAQGVRDLDALQTGLAFLPLTIVSMVASLALTEPVVSRVGLRTALTAGLAVNTLGLALLATAMTQDGSLWLFLLAFVVWGIGGGVTFPLMFAAAGEGIEPSLQAQASALATTAQQVGGAAGLAVVVAAATSDLSGVNALRAAAAVAAGFSLAAVLLAALRPAARPAARPVTADTRAG